MTPSNRFIGFLVFFEFTVYMANDLIMPGMIQLVQEFHAEDSLIPLSLSVYLLGGILLQMVIGPISDRLGRRPTMIFGCIFFSLFTFLITLSGSMSSYLVLRLFQGMGLAFIPVCGYASVQELYEEKKAVRVVAWMGSVAVLAPILGPILGGFLIQLAHWRGIFIVLLFCSLISALGLWRTMPESSPRDASKQEKTSFFKSVKRGTNQSFHTYIRILKNKKVILGSLFNGLISAPVLCWISVSPLILFERAHISPKYYGLVQLPIFGSYIFGSALLRTLTHRFTLNQIIRLGMPFGFLSILLFAILMFAFPNSYWSYIIPLSLFCFVGGIISAPITRKTLYASREPKGSVSAVFQMISTGVLVLAVSLMPFLF